MLGYVYLLLDPDTEEPRYIGQTVDLARRHRQHCREDRREDCRRARWLRKLRRQGKQPLLRVVHVTTAQQAPVDEKVWIAHFRMGGIDLVNGTEGGDGCVGLVHSNETKQRLREFATGRTQSAETREKQSLAQKGKSKSEEWKRKIGAAHKGQKRSDETRKRISENHVGFSGQHHREETLIKMKVCWGNQTRVNGKTPPDPEFNNVKQLLSEGSSMRSISRLLRMSVRRVKRIQQGRVADES